MLISTNMRIFRNFSVNDQNQPELHGCLSFQPALPCFSVNSFFHCGKITENRLQKDQLALISNGLNNKDQRIKDPIHLISPVS